MKTAEQSIVHDDSVSEDKLMKAICRIYPWPTSQVVTNTASASMAESRLSRPSTRYCQAGHFTHCG